jgi:hypothetical protein
LCSIIIIIVVVDRHFPRLVAVANRSLLIEPTQVVELNKSNQKLENGNASAINWQSMRNHRWIDGNREGMYTHSSKTKETNFSENIQAIALEYLRHGAKVAVNHLGGASDDALVEAFHKDATEVLSGEEKRFITVAGDISKPETGANFVAKIVETFGRLDIFVSNAGVCQFAEFLE